MVSTIRTRRQHLGTPIAGNVISGNAQNGIAMLGSVVVSGPDLPNKIGANVLRPRRSPIASGRHPHRRCASTDDRWASLARNVIGGNGQNGIGDLRQRLRSAAVREQIIGNTIGYRLIALREHLGGVHLGLAGRTPTSVAIRRTRQPDHEQRPQRRDGAIGSGNRSTTTRSPTTPSSGHRSRRRRRDTERRRRRRRGPERSAELPGADGRGRRRDREHSTARRTRRTSI